MVSLLFLTVAFYLTDPLASSSISQSLETSTYSSDALIKSQRYVRVAEKMEKFCAQEYRESDDKIIDMYTVCFSNLIKAVSMDFSHT